MIVLGVDPGSIRTGWGVIERRGATLHGLAYGVIQPGKGEALHRRLCTIHRELGQVIALHRPMTMAVEDVFFARNARSALVLGQARGVCLLAGAEADLIIHEYPPALVKRSVAGRGAAPKAQLARIVGVILRLPSSPSADAADALAIAITHANAAPVRGP